MRNACDVLGLESDEGFSLACVGESHYQRALELVCGERTVEGVDLEVIASLVLETTTPTIVKLSALTCMAARWAT
jgi:hypothetical protein